MKIGTIPSVFRNLNRLREIVSVLIKYGLADWISRLDLEFAKDLLKDPAKEKLARLNRPTRIRLALAELGPTFIKLGQILSTRADLIGVELADEFSQLQSSAPADSPDVARRTIETELGQPIEELFSEFEDKALASASIGQVHLARSKSGQRMVVKVQHSGIEEKIRVDLEILVGAAQLAEMSPEFKNFRPRALVAEFQRMLRRELDFGREERHMQHFAEEFRDNPTVHIPRVYPDLCTGRVLTMEYLEGVKLSDQEGARLAGLDREEIARRGAELYLTMIFANGCYHADPHPGNVVLMPGNRIGLLDFGMIGRIDEGLRENIEEMLMALSNRDAVHLTNIITRLGMVPPELDRVALSVDVADYVAHYAYQKFEEFDLAGAMNELLEMIRRYRIILPSGVALLIKTLVMLEGTSRLLHPRFSLMELMGPHRKKLIWRRLSPARRLKKLQRLGSEIDHLVEMAPRGLMDILQQVQSGKFDVHLDHRGLEPSVNRLVLGMLASALFVGSALLLSREVGPIIPWPPFVAQTRLSLLGVIGCGVSIALGLRLLRAINKSGHLDRR